MSPSSKILASGEPVHVERTASSTGTATRNSRDLSLIDGDGSIHGVKIPMHASLIVPMILVSTVSRRANLPATAFLQLDPQLILPHKK
jgi:hypothetical protein